MADNILPQEISETPQGISCCESRRLSSWQTAYYPRRVWGCLLRDMGEISLPCGINRHEPRPKNQAVIVAYQFGGYYYDRSIATGRYSEVHFLDIFGVIMDGALVPVIVRPILPARATF